MRGLIAVAGLAWLLAACASTAPVADPVEAACLAKGGSPGLARSGVPVCNHSYTAEERAACDARGGEMLHASGEPWECVIDVTPEERAACIAKGGVWQRPGDPIRPRMCVIRFDDGGQTCTDGAQCQSGLCQNGESEPRKDKRGRVIGRCTHFNYIDSCAGAVEDGVLDSQFCF